MQFARYEEYIRFEGELPFVLYTKLQRSYSNCAKEANWHESPEIQLCTDGEGWVLLNGETYPFRPGDIVVANSNELHYTATNGQLEYSCLILDTHFCKRVGVEYKNLLFASHIHSEKLCKLFQQIETLYETDVDFRSVKLCALTTQLLLELCQFHSRQKGGAYEKDMLDKVKTVIRYTRQHLNERLTLDTLAQIALCDKYALTRAFKKATGQTIVTYINRLRCHAAANMLANGARVTEAAVACGFENFSYFTKTFKKYMGKMPSAYKKRAL